MSEDQTKAKALELAAAKLKSSGWKFSMQDIGKSAADMLNAFDEQRAGKPLPEPPTPPHTGD